MGRRAPMSKCFPPFHSPTLQLFFLFSSTVLVSATAVWASSGVIPERGSLC